jgi:hypothetical protein
MDEVRLEYALEGLRRFRAPEATRAEELLLVAAEHSRQRSNRWTEQMCYALREALDEIPPLCGQPRLKAAMGAVARQFAERMADAAAIDSPPDLIRRLTSEFLGQLDVAEEKRRYRIAQAMLAQMGTDSSRARIEDFAAEWTRVVEGVNNILHGDVHTEARAEALLDRAVNLVAALLGSVSDKLDDVDRLSSLRDPTEESAIQVLALLADDQVARYFYANSDAGSWLTALDERGLFSTPMHDDWYQGELLVRASDERPEEAAAIAARLIGDSHPAAPVVVLGVVERVGGRAADLAITVLKRPAYPDAYRVANALRSLVTTWGATEHKGILPTLADVSLTPQPSDGSPYRLGAKFGEYEYGELAKSFIDASACEALGDLLRVLGFKLRSAESLLQGHLGLTWQRDLVVTDDSYDRSVGDVLISAVRDTLERMRECGYPLTERAAALGEIEGDIVVRIWAAHLAQEEEA